MSISKKQIKVVTVKAPKVPKFDLSFKKTTENTKILMAIESLQFNQGWAFLVQVFQENINTLANQIINKVDEMGQSIKDSDVDVLRMKHSYLKELVGKPDYFLKALKKVAPEENDLDPYDKGQE